METVTKAKQETVSSIKEDAMYVGYKVRLSRRPERTTAISHEDIINLKIALETCKSLEEFLALV